MASSASIRRLEAYGIHGRFDYKIDFFPDLNVLHGRNGSGKTTLLHILANALNRSIERFAFLKFDHIVISVGGRRLILLREIDASGSELLRVQLGRRELGSIPIELAARYAQGEADESERRQVEAIKGQLPFSPPAYFPAFRTMIEAWSSMEAEAYIRRYGGGSTNRPIVPSMSSDRETHPTALARSLFGDFVPDIRYPSPQVIERELGAEARMAALRAAEVGRTGLSQAFARVIQQALTGAVEPTDSTEELLRDTAGLLERLDETRVLDDGARDPSREINRMLRDNVGQSNGTDSNANRIAPQLLTAYRDALQRHVKVQDQLSAPILRYVDSVNDFLEDKQLVVTRRNAKVSEGRTDRQERVVWIRFQDASIEPLRSLSSGERQIVSMLYAARSARHAGEGEGSLVLIDEPELSLHLDWQRPLLAKMASQLGKRQIIVCTHSPEIGTEHADRFQQIEPRHTAARKRTRRVRVASSSK